MVVGRCTGDVRHWREVGVTAEAPSCGREASSGREPVRFVGAVTQAWHACYVGPSVSGVQQMRTGRGQSAMAHELREADRAPLRAPASYLRPLRLVGRSPIPEVREDDRVKAPSPDTLPAIRTAVARRPCWHCAGSRPDDHLVRRVRRLPFELRGVRGALGQLFDDDGATSAGGGCSTWGSDDPVTKANVGGR